MRLFIWERVKHATNNWHTEGGLVVMAENLEKAREELHVYGVPVDCEAFASDPDYSYQIADPNEGTTQAEQPGVVAVFPDSGCC